MRRNKAVENFFSKIFYFPAAFRFQPTLFARPSGVALRAAADEIVEVRHALSVVVARVGVERTRRTVVLGDAPLRQRVADQVFIEDAFAVELAITDRSR